MEQFEWMAWTLQTAAFFAGIACLLGIMTVLAFRRPEPERIGVLGIVTTRGDRLFLTLLLAAFVHLAWLGFFDPDLLFVASGLSVLAGAAVFRWT